MNDYFWLILPQTFDGECDATDGTAS